MPKTKSRWVCQECGFQSSRSLGRCTECEAWNSLVEEVAVEEVVAKGFSARLNAQSASAQLWNSTGSGAGFGTGTGIGPGTDGEVRLRPLLDIGGDDTLRMSTGLQSLDEVLGGGLVPGSVVLLAGDPGIGKSTLLLQVAQHLAAKQPVLYVTGEESSSQVRIRAGRLGISSGEILIDAQQNVAAITQAMLSSQTRIAIIDSIQSIYHPEISSAPGSVSQVREGAQLVISAAKSMEVATILVGHVTKDGSIAGPRVLEHMVDVVLQFEGDHARNYRMLRAVKNRYGSTQELAVFTMTELGLREVDNPSALFLSDRIARVGRKQAPSGTAVIAGGEGNRTLLLEVQALVANSYAQSPRRVANGWDYNRLLQLAAVLEKKAGLFFSACDIYINIVGGFEFNDPSGDLGIAAALTTSLLDRSVDPSLVFVGEVGLTGEVRAVPQLEKRLKEAAKLGFKRAIVPRANLGQMTAPAGLEVVGVELLVEALKAAIPDFDQKRGSNAGTPAKASNAPLRRERAESAERRGRAESDDCN